MLTHFWLTRLSLCFLSASFSMLTCSCPHLSFYNSSFTLILNDTCIHTHSSNSYIYKYIHLSIHLSIHLYIHGSFLAYFFHEKKKHLKHARGWHWNKQRWQKKTEVIFVNDQHSLTLKDPAWESHKRNEDRKKGERQPCSLIWSELKRCELWAGSGQRRRVKAVHGHCLMLWVGSMTCCLKGNTSSSAKWWNKLMIDGEEGEKCGDNWESTSFPLNGKEIIRPTWG